MVDSPFAFEQNLLLATLAPQDRDYLVPHLEHLTLNVYAFMERPGVPITHVYFPLSGLGSVVAIGSRQKDQRIETAIVGREGMSGIPVVLGVDRGPCEVYMQIAGDALRMPVEALRDALDARPAIRGLLLRYAYAAQVQTAYTALANGRDKIETRLARWLLMAHDRVDGDVLRLTHEFLSLMLGVRRAGVTVSTQSLEHAGLISTGRGTFTLLDREGLVAIADGSYGTPEAEYARVIGRPI